ncbi:hypothetical protein ACSS6W_007146 [Trichoderma asperelloides]
MAHPRRGTKDERQTIPPQATSDMGDIWRSLSGRNDSLGGLGKDYLVESRVPGKADDDRVFAYCSTDATSNRVKSLAQSRQIDGSPKQSAAIRPAAGHSEFTAGTGDYRQTHLNLFSQSIYTLLDKSRRSVNDNSYKLYRIWCHEDRRDMSEFIPNSDTRESFNRSVFGSI